MDLETTGMEKFKKRTDRSIRLIAIHRTKKGLGYQLEKILLSAINFNFISQLVIWSLFTVSIYLP